MFSRVWRNCLKFLQKQCSHYEENCWFIDTVFSEPGNQKSRILYSTEWCCTCGAIRKVPAPTSWSKTEECMLPKPEEWRKPNPFFYFSD